MVIFTDILTHRELLFELVKREIKARYKQSILGYAWVILVPLINLVVLSIVFSFLIHLPTGGIPYPIFLFTVLVPWNFTSNAISSATVSLSSNSSLVTKINLPREVFPISAILAKAVDLILSVLILVGLFIYFGLKFHYTFFYIPLIFFTHFLLILGISFILSAINVFYRDVQNILAIALTMWMYLTPILYPPELIPEKFLPLFNINPLMPIINSYRNVTLYGVAPPWQSYIYSIVFSLTIFVFGYIFFKKRSRYFADVV